MKKSICLVLAGMLLVIGSAATGQAYVRGGIWVGPVWGPGYWGPYYGYPHYYPPYYSAPIVVRQEPQQYIYQSTPQSLPKQYRYFCPDPQGYYPQVPRCPKGWLKVLPEPAAPPDKE